MKAVVEVKGLPFDLRPNNETREAIQEHKTKKLKTYTIYEDMMKDIDEED